jgi:hypothetical protein
MSIWGQFSVLEQAEQLVEYLWVQEGEWRVYLVAWQEGKKVASWHTRREDMQASLLRASTKISETLEQKGVKWAVDMHLHYLEDIRPYDAATFVLGQESIGIKKANGDQVRYYGAYVFEHNYKQDKLEQNLCAKAWLPDACFVDADHEVLMARTRHVWWHQWRMHTYRSGEEMNITLTRTYLEESLDRAEQWLTHNLRPDGTFNYLYMPSRGSYSSNNNMIRQCMWSRILAQRCLQDKKMCAEHQRNLSAIFDLWYAEQGEEGYLEYAGKSKLGANALLLRVLAASPYLDDYAAQAQKLVAGIVSLVQADGSLRAWYRAPEYEYDEDYLLTFYSGEAILGLAEYALRTQDESLWMLAKKIQDKYLQKYVEEIETHYYPAYVPRHTMSLSALYHKFGDPAYRDAIFLLNEKLIDEMLERDTSKPLEVGRFYNDDYPQYGTPHSASDGVYLEGLGYAYVMAVQEWDTRRAALYKESLLLWAKNLLRLQYTSKDTYFLEYPERVMGAVHYRIDDNRIRIDTTQHMIDAFDVLLRSPMLFSES